MSQGQQVPMQRLARMKAFLVQDPDNPHLQKEVFDAALAEGALADAHGQVAEALRRSPLDQVWRGRLAVLQLAAGRCQEARDVLAQLVEEGVADPTTRYNLAYAQFGAGAVHTAREAAAPLRELPEVSALAWPLWLRCCHHSSQASVGLEGFLASAAHGAMPAEAWGVASLMALDESRFKEAEAWANRALGSEPGQLEALLTLGSLALGRRDPKAAIELFGLVLNRKPEDGRTWSGLAFAQILQTDLAAAEASFHRAIANMPFHIGTWLGLGWCEVFQGKLAEARKAVEQALDLDRNFGESHGALAVVLAYEGRPDEAAMEIRKAVGLDPNGLSAKFAQMVIDGVTQDPEAFARIAEPLLRNLLKSSNRI